VSNTGDRVAMKLSNDHTLIGAGVRTGVAQNRRLHERHLYGRFPEKSASQRSYQRRRRRTVLLLLQTGQITNPRRRGKGRCYSVGVRSRIYRSR